MYPTINILMSLLLELWLYDFAKYRISYDE